MLKSLFLGVAALSAFSLPALAQQTPIPKAPDYVLTEAPDDHAIGDVTAPTTMIVWASVTCGHCGSWFSDEWPTVKKELVETGKLRFVMRELPTAPAALSMTGFMMAECAPKDSYFDVIEYQMKQQEDIFADAKAGKGQEAYAKVGALAGLNNDTEIEACLRDESQFDHISLSQDRAEAAKVKGVPAFFVNGVAYKGPQDSKTIVDMIKTMDEMGVSTMPDEMTREDAHTDHSGHKH
ncbi:thioredoxin domain-containing protein [Litorimonas sp. RW-G-Af-16]|uniref:thioredoxin domain-containing protein n=1 Tax=Litorimonas sp. RW-G-Af-16 TaxID=3241168 RepID=UPI00390CD616